MSPDKKPAPSEPREDPGKIYEQLVQSFSEAVRKMQA